MLCLEEHKHMMLSSNAYPERQESFACYKHDEKPNNCRPGSKNKTKMRSPITHRYIHLDGKMSWECNIHSTGPLQLRSDKHIAATTHLLNLCAFCPTAYTSRLISDLDKSHIILSSMKWILNYMESRQLSSKSICWGKCVGCQFPNLFIFNQ